MDQSEEVRLDFQKNPAALDAQLVGEGFQSELAALIGSSRREAFAIFLRREDGSIAGGLLGKLLFDDLHIDVVWVDEGARGKGHGKRMLDEAEAYAVREGCERAVFNTMMPGVAEACRRFGYAEVGRVDDFAGGKPVVFLRKELGSGRM